MEPYMNRRQEDQSLLRVGRRFRYGGVDMTITSVTEHGPEGPQVGLIVGYHRRKSDMALKNTFYKNRPWVESAVRAYFDSMRAIAE